MDGIELLRQIKKGKIKEDQIIVVTNKITGKKINLMIKDNNLRWKPGEFETQMLVNDNYSFEVFEELHEEENKPSTKTYTEFNFNHVELCKGLNEDILKKLGFTNYYKPNWCFCRTISKSKTGNFSETFNLTIKKNFTEMDTDILDEAFLQPCLPYCEYYLGKKTFEECTPYIQEGIKKCDEYIRFLIENGVIKFKE